MRNSLALVAGTAALAIAAAPAQAQIPLRWTLAAQTANQSFLITLEPSRASGAPELRKLKVLMLRNTAPAFHGIKVGTENDWEFNCVAHTWRWVVMRELTRDGTIFSENAKPSEWTPLKPGTTEYMAGFACGDTKPIGPAYADRKAAIDALTKITPE